MVLKLLLVVGPLHVDKIDHYDPAHVSEPELPTNLLGGLHVSLQNRITEPGAADLFSSVHIDRSERLCLIDNQRPTALQGHLVFEQFV